MHTLIACSKAADSEFSICQEFDDEAGNIFFERIEHEWKNGKCIHCGASEINYSRDRDLETHAYQFIHDTPPERIKNMKFDVIIGNPPYQLSDGGAQSSAAPIYNFFVDHAKKLNPRFLSMIIPARWFTGGKGLDQFRKEMLQDRRLIKLVDYHDAAVCFPGVEIKGGVCYFLWSRDEEGPCQIRQILSDGSETESSRELLENGATGFIRYNRAVSILEKVKNKNYGSFEALVSSRKPFGIETNFDKFSANKRSDTTKIFGHKLSGFVSNDRITKNRDLVNKIKLLVPYAIGSGDPKTDRVKSILAEEPCCCTETYLVIGPFKNAKEARNVQSYIGTRFFHFFLTLKKNTQHTTKAVYEYVPCPPFDQEWTDGRLYEHFNLDRDDIRFIESLVLPGGI